jgi:serine/threonine-protein kinase HipA
MEREILVYLDLDGVSHFVGRLWAHIRKGREGATFEYDREWLENPRHFTLEPALHLGPGPQHTKAGQAIFGAIGDSAPDRWGRLLMRRDENARAKAEGRGASTLYEADFLLRVDDRTRLGALRFKEKPNGPFLAPPQVKRIPPLIEIPRLLDASRRVEAEDDTDEDLRILLAPGSSLGGAHPKASVRDRDGELAIAKFPSAKDSWNRIAWEAVALTLAAAAGIDTPQWRLEPIAGKPVLILKRFDRAGEIRIPFLSAMSLLGAGDHETRSYLDIADSLLQVGAEPKADRAQLWQRLVFTILISNFDDHLRNHGLLYAGGSGWRLAPAYDMNPTPIDIKPRILSTAIMEEDVEASLDRALEAARYFGLDFPDAKAILRKTAAEISGWRPVATDLGLSKTEITRMESAFEHKEMAFARSFPD